MKDFFIKNKLGIAAFFLIISAVIFFFDKGLSAGLCLLAVLSCITFFILNKSGFKDKKIYLLFLFALLVHLAVTLFIFYAGFHLFSAGGGDASLYQKSAIEASDCFKQGIFSTKNITSKYADFYSGHCYPVVIGALYTLTLPAEMVGLILNVWLTAVTIVFVYLIILEIGGSVKNAFIIGLATAVYPSYIYYTGLLLKDAFEIFFVFFGLLFLIRTVKKFSWYNFLILYLSLICATHFRFYIGYALIIAFILSWFLFSKTNFKKRMIYGFILIIILGFVPQLASPSHGYGYYGIGSVRGYLNFKTVNYYRQIVYNPANYAKPSPTEASPSSGLDSSFKTGNLFSDYVKSSVYVLLGPFPWQIKNSRQSLILFETLPWYVLLFFVIDGMIVCFKKRTTEAAPLLIFSIITIIIMAIFDSNFGIITRIRIPSFISLLCFASFGLNKNNILYNYYEKILGYGRSRFHRFKHS